MSSPPSGDAVDGVAPQPDESLRSEDHHDNRHDTHDERVVLPVGRYDFANEDEQAGADDRTEQRSGPANDRPNDGLAGHVIEHIRRGGVAAKKGEQCTRHSGQEACHYKRNQAQQINVEANQ